MEQFVAQGTLTWRPWRGQDRSTRFSIRESRRAATTRGTTLGTSRTITRTEAHRVVVIHPAVATGSPVTTSLVRKYANANTAASAETVQKSLDTSGERRSSILDDISTSRTEFTMNRRMNPTINLRRDGSQDAAVHSDYVIHRFTNRRDARSHGGREHCRCAAPRLTDDASAHTATRIEPHFVDI